MERFEVKAQPQLVQFHQEHLYKNLNLFTTSNHVIRFMIHCLWRTDVNFTHEIISADPKKGEKLRFIL